MKNKINIESQFLLICNDLGTILTYYNVYSKVYPKTVNNILIKEKHIKV